MRYFYLLLITSFFIACKEPQARKPVSVKSGAFLQNSVERTKKRLEKENDFILAYIKKDSLNTYIDSNKGFWYTYISKDTLNTKTPSFGDKILYTYTINDLNNTSIYTVDEIGDQVYYIDQEAEIIEGFRQGLKLLKPNEEIKFIFPSQLAYGYRGDGNKIDVNIPIICNVLLKEIITKKD